MLGVNRPAGKGVKNHYATWTSLGAAGRGWRGFGTTLPWHPFSPGSAPAAPNPSEQRMKMQKPGIILRAMFGTQEARKGFC